MREGERKKEREREREGGGEGERGGGGGLGGPGCCKRKRVKSSVVGAGDPGIAPRYLLSCLIY